MIKYVIKRIVQMIPILIGVSLLVFFMLSFSPGDPARLALGMNAKPEQIEAFNRENGLDQPIPVQYFSYMKKLVTGNLGTSYTTKQSVASMIAVRLPATCILAFGSLFFTYLLSIPLGILLAVKQDIWFDDTYRVIALLASSMPSFWLGMLLILLFAVNLNVLPSKAGQPLPGQRRPHHPDPWGTRYRHLYLRSGIPLRRRRRWLRRRSGLSL